MCIVIKDKYIDPFTDFGFKHIFGSESNKKFLISFLNDLLDIKHKIVDLRYRNLEQLGLNILDRRAVFDVYCTDEKGGSFIVELQRSKQRFFKDRSLYYTSFPIQEQSKRGDWNYELKRIYFVGILEFEIDANPNYLTKVQLMETQTKELFYDKLTYYYVQMPKFKKNEEELLNHLEYWLYFLNNLAELKHIPSKLRKDEVIREAFDEAEFLALDKNKQFSYQLDLKTRLDNKNTFDYAKEIAKEEGIKQGIKQGIEQGIKQGKLTEKLEIAKNLLKADIPVPLIVKSTGLSEDEINNISL